MISMAFLFDLFSVLGTVAFALSAVLAARGRQVDLFTILVLATVTAVGGGTIRDTLLDVPIFWAEDTSYLWIAGVSAMLGFFFYTLLDRRYLNMLYQAVDSVAIALFGVLGTTKAWELGFGLPLGPVILGVITATGGGVVRDVLLQRPSMLLGKELYIVPVALGCTLHAGFLALAPQHAELGALLAIALVLVLRYGTLRRHWSVPQWGQLKLK
ncbi:trimeric intracellular cation channel family protein [Ferrimonas balearica]|uniref:trimeric intracellular cation channel family protein n=1 Tax=Ferrimonas balearica TaxID=44012 RepID=UPI001C996BB9|nr:trimeric intracellular cation channel family protein [Ferrimonas balearica]MBY5993155.1 trimeric intracellular cation channel family protein [Ferrimonas balearica]